MSRMRVVQACIVVLLVAVLVSAVLGAIGAPFLVRIVCLALVAVGAALAMRRLADHDARRG